MTSFTETKSRNGLRRVAPLLGAVVALSGIAALGLGQKRERDGDSETQGKGGLVYTDEGSVTIRYDRIECPELNLLLQKLAYANSKINQKIFLPLLCPLDELKVNDVRYDDDKGEVVCTFEDVWKQASAYRDAHPLEQPGVEYSSRIFSLSQIDDFFKSRTNNDISARVSGAKACAPIVKLIRDLHEIQVPPATNLIERAINLISDIKLEECVSLYSGSIMSPQCTIAYVVDNQGADYFAQTAEINSKTLTSAEEQKEKFKNLLDTFRTISLPSRASSAQTNGHRTSGTDMILEEIRVSLIEGNEGYLQVLNDFRDALATYLEEDKNLLRSPQVASAEEVKDQKLEFYFVRVKPAFRYNFNRLLEKRTQLCSRYSDLYSMEPLTSSCAKAARALRLDRHMVEDDK